jgi:hypothetical protein
MNYRPLLWTLFPSLESAEGDHRKEEEQIIRRRRHPGNPDGKAMHGLETKPEGRLPTYGQKRWLE